MNASDLSAKYAASLIVLLGVRRVERGFRDEQRTGVAARLRRRTGAWLPPGAGRRGLWPRSRRSATTAWERAGPADRAGRGAGGRGRPGCAEVVAALAPQTYESLGERAQEIAGARRGGGGGGARVRAGGGAGCCGTRRPRRRARSASAARADSDAMRAAAEAHADGRCPRRAAERRRDAGRGPRGCSGGARRGAGRDGRDAPPHRGRAREQEQEHSRAVGGGRA